MEPPQSNPKPTRRTFVDWLMGLGAVATVASALYPVLRYLRPLETGGAGGPVRLTPEQRAKLQQDRFVIVRSLRGPLIVFWDEADKLRALSAVCTHEACIVQLKREESIVWCACHDGRFGLDGRVISGPPPAPLARFTAREMDDEVAVILEPPA